MYQNFLAASTFVPTGEKAFRLYEVLMEHEHCNVQESLASHFPEHREEEARDLDPHYPVDPSFDRRPDSFEPAPSNLSTRQRIDWEDLRLKGGRVIGRHEVVTDLPYFLTAQFIARKLGCTVAQGRELSKLWRALDATESMVLAFIDEIRSVDAAIQYYSNLVEQLPRANPDDALEHRSGDEGVVGHTLSPERALLALETIPSAAMIAHLLHISLAKAGEIREEMLRTLVDPQICIDRPEDEEEGEGEEEEDDAVLGEGWHLMDDADQRDPDAWLNAQPAHVQVTIAKVRRATTLAELGRLAQKVYAEPERWSKTQAGAFWAEYSARKQHVQHDLLRRHARLRRAVEKLRTLQGADLARAGKRLFALHKEQPSFYPPDGWSVLWREYKALKAGA